MTILGFGIEGRAGFVYSWEVAVALNLCVWVLLSPSMKNLAERVFLALRSIVKRIAARINAPNIGYVK